MAILDVQHIEKSFGSTKVLRDINFSLEEGQVLAIIGSSGSGKTTLLQMIKRIVPPMSNEIITLVKDTSLARIIAVYELTFTGYSYMKSSGLVWPLLYTGVFYLVFVGILTLLFNFIERKLSYFR